MTWCHTLIDAQNFPREHLEMMSKFSNMAGYRVKLHKSIGFLYTNNANTEKELIETPSTTTSTPKI